MNPRGSAPSAPKWAQLWETLDFSLFRDFKYIVFCPAWDRVSKAAALHHEWPKAKRKVAQTTAFLRRAHWLMGEYQDVSVSLDFKIYFLKKSLIALVIINEDSYIEGKAKVY